MNLKQIIKPKYEKSCKIIEKHLSDIYSLRNPIIQSLKNQNNQYFTSDEYLYEHFLNNNIDNYYSQNTQCQKIREFKLGEKIMPEIIKIFPDHYIYNSGAFYYRKNDFMGWHTNNDMPGLRLYITYVDEDLKSYFKYKHPINQKIYTDYDNKGFNVRLFEINENNTLWHCVYSDCNRISIGFNIIEK